MSNSAEHIGWDSDQRKSPRSELPYATAFWGRYLKGESGYDAFLSDNKYAGKIIFKR